MKKGEKMIAKDIIGLKIDDGICYKCAHLHEKGFSCEAFPEGIPPEILNGTHNHKLPYTGDNGIRFKLNELFK